MNSYRFSDVAEVHTGGYIFRVRWDNDNQYHLSEILDSRNILIYTQVYRWRQDAMRDFADNILWKIPAKVEQNEAGNSPCEGCDIPSDGSCFRDCPSLGTNYDDMTPEV